MRAALQTLFLLFCEDHEGLGRNADTLLYLLFLKIRSCYVAKAGLKFMILLPSLLELQAWATMTGCCCRLLNLNKSGSILINTSLHEQGEHYSDEILIFTYMSVHLHACLCTMGAWYLQKPAECIRLLWAVVNWPVVLGTEPWSARAASAPTYWASSPATV